MGEWSKKIGETGEDIAGEFLRLVGWGTAQHGVELPCLSPEAHKTSAGDRRTHGIDYLFPCRSPLTDGVGQNLVVSVKFSAEPYPKNPVRIFKSHFTDLAQTIECFKCSEIRRGTLQAVKGVSKTQDIGVLLWFTNDREGDGDVVKQLPRVILPDTLAYEAIYVVDNNRAQFVFDSFRYAKSLENGFEVEGLYHNLRVILG